MKRTYNVQWSDIGLIEVDEKNRTVWIDGIKHKRQDLYWKRSK